MQVHMNLYFHTHTCTHIFTQKHARMSTYAAYVHTFMHSHTCEYVCTHVMHGHTHIIMWKECENVLDCNILELSEIIPHCRSSWNAGYPTASFDVTQGVHSSNRPCMGTGLTHITSLWTQWSLKYYIISVFFQGMHKELPLSIKSDSNVSLFLLTPVLCLFFIWTNINYISEVNMVFPRRLGLELCSLTQC